MLVAVGLDSAGELVDVVDLDDRVLRTVTRAEVRARRLRHRCTFVILRDARGCVLVHRRSEGKDVWPGHWDLCAGGVVTSGEGWADAAARELAEELGVRGVELRLLGGGRYDDGDVSEIGRVYTASWDGPLSFDDGEVVEARWLTLRELEALVTSQPFVPDSLALALPLLVP